MEECTEVDDDVSDIFTKLIDSVVETHISPECDTTIDFRSLTDHSNSKTSGTDSSVDRSKQRCVKKKGGKRDRKHKWKPYQKLTGNERRRRDERNTRRAEAQHRRRIQVWGLTSAPFNTTQYLMKEHEQDNVRGKDDYNSSEDFYSSPEDDIEFIQKEFSEVYDTYHESYINNLSNAELVRELIRLEDEIDRLEHGTEIGLYGTSLSDTSPEFRKIQVFRNEIDKLTFENHNLEMRNQMLQSQVSKLNAV